MSRAYTDNASKWSRSIKEYVPWWQSLTEAQKIQAKSHFLKVREANKKRRVPFPDMYNIKDLRLSQLTEKHIYRIWCFKDHVL